MARVLLIISVVLMLGLRLLMPPVPQLLRSGLQRWGARSTILLCALAWAGALAIFVLRR